MINQTSTGLLLFFGTEGLQKRYNWILFCTYKGPAQLRDNLKWLGSNERNYDWRKKKKPTLIKLQAKLEHYQDLLNEELNVWMSKLLGRLPRPWTTSWYGRYCLSNTSRRCSCCSDDDAHWKAYYMWQSTPYSLDKLLYVSLEEFQSPTKRLREVISRTHAQQR